MKYLEDRVNDSVKLFLAFAWVLLRIFFILCVGYYIFKEVGFFTALAITSIYINTELILIEVKRHD